MAQSPQKAIPKWDEKTCNLANTAKNTSYLTEEEKKVIYLINLARLNPKLFLQTYLEDYKKQPDVKRNKYIVSLEKELNEAKPLPVLEPDETLYKMAKEHAKEMGKKGLTGHTAPRGNTFENRAKYYLNDYNYASENCQYGFKDALEIVLDLLIDEDIQDVGHRKNILNSKAKLIGVSIQPHKVYDWNCVMDFGNKKI